MESLIQVSVKEYEFSVSESTINRQINLKDFRDMKQWKFKGKIFLNVSGGRLNKGLTVELMERSNLKAMIREECLLLMPNELIVAELLTNNYEKTNYYITLITKARSNKKLGDCIEIEFDIDETNLSSFVDGITRFSCTY